MSARYASVQTCVDCWNEQSPEHKVNPDDYHSGVEGTCHFCGSHTDAGIFVRAQVEGEEA